jgi:putative membrane protein
MKRLVNKLIGAQLLCAMSGIGAGAAWAADAPTTADVLGKLHHADQKEIDMGKLATERAQSKDVKTFGKMLIKDHTAGDKKVAKLARDEKIDLTAGTPAAKDDSTDMPMGADFDAAFARMMLDDHKRDIDEVTTARDATTDEKLKKLLTDLLPVLERHRDTAQKLVDANNKS